MWEMLWFIVSKATMKEEEWMKAVTFGEIMLRLKTPEYLRIVQSNSFEASYGGAEANVAVSLAMLGDQVSFVTI